MTTTTDDEDRGIEYDLADAAIDALYSAFGNATGCPVEDTDIATFRSALTIALTTLDDTVARGERLRCGFCGSAFGVDATGRARDLCPQGCAEQEVNGGVDVARRRAT